MMLEKLNVKINLNIMLCIFCIEYYKIFLDILHFYISASNELNECPWKWIIASKET